MLELELGAEFTMATTVTLFIPLDFFSHHDQAHKIVLTSNGSPVSLWTLGHLKPNCGKIGQAHWGPKD